MRRRLVTRERYLALLEAFRENPGAYTQVGKVVGCSPQVAKAGYLEGWPLAEDLDCRQPISERLREEQEAARGQLAKMTAERSLAIRSQALDDAASSIAATGVFIRGARLTVATLLRQVHEREVAALELAPAVSAYYASLVARVQAGEALGPSEIKALAAMQARDAFTVKALSSAAESLAKIEALQLGNPLAPEPEDDPGEVSLEEAEEQIRRAQAALDAARARRTPGRSVVEGD